MVRPRHGALSPIVCATLLCLAAVGNARLDSPPPAVNDSIDRGSWAQWYDDQLPPPSPPVRSQTASPAFATQVPAGRAKRWPGWATTTVFVGTQTITAGGGGAVGVQTVTMTALNDATVTDTQIATVTQAQVTVTTTVLGGVVIAGQSTTTTTLYAVPSTSSKTTTRSTSTLYVGGVATLSPANTGAVRANRPCLPGDQHEKYGGSITPTNPTQTSTLYAIAIYWVAILVGWNLFIVRQLIYPAKLLTVAWHEFGHVLACAFTGVHLQSVTIDPNEGGSTRMDAPAYPIAGLPAGYIMSILIGGLLTFCGFDTLASKVASFFIGISWLVVFWWAAGLLTRVLTLVAIALMIALWFIDHSSGLRYYVLFFGVMSSFYVIYDSMDDFLFRKVNPCCSVLFEERFGRPPAGTWALIWIAVSTIFFIGMVLAALAAWRQTPHGMFCQSQQFLPT